MYAEYCCIYEALVADVSEEDKAVCAELGMSCGLCDHCGWKEARN